MKYNIFCFVGDKISIKRDKKSQIGTRNFTKKLTAISNEVLGEVTSQYFILI